MTQYSLHDYTRVHDQLKKANSLAIFEVTRAQEIHPFEQLSARR